MPRAALLLLLAALTAAVQAGDIYRWVDEDGKTHVSDVVPDKYKASARRIGGGQDPTPQARKEAEDRAAADRARAAAQSKTGARATQKPAGAPVSTANETECERARRLYKESTDCFARYVNANGSFRAEAAQNCKAVPDPTSRCGAAQPESSERTYSN